MSLPSSFLLFTHLICSDALASAHLCAQQLDRLFVGYPIPPIILVDVLSWHVSLLFWFFHSSWRKWRGPRGWTLTSRAAYSLPRPSRRETGDSARERWRGGRTEP